MMQMNLEVALSKNVFHIVLKKLYFLGEAVFVYSNSEWVQS